MKRKCCIFTIVKNEKFFLPIWLKYYTQYFDGKDIYVLNHQSDDGSVEECLAKYKFNIENVYNENYDEEWKVKIASQKQADLLKDYDYTLYCDADEILVPNVRQHINLGEYILHLESEHVSCIGYEIIHMKDREPSINCQQSILEQRSYWYRNNMYDKHLLSASHLVWSPGFHTVENQECSPKKELLLIHLAKVDYLIRKDKVKSLASLKWGDGSLSENYGWQLRLKDSTDFDKWFYTQREPKWYHYLLSVPYRILKSKMYPSWEVWKEKEGIVMKIPTSLKESKVI